MSKLPCSYTVYKGKAKSWINNNFKPLFYLANLRLQMQINTDKTTDINQYRFDLHMQIYK